MISRQEARREVAEKGGRRGQSQERSTFNPPPIFWMRKLRPNKPVAESSLAHRRQRQ